MPERGTRSATGARCTTACNPDQPRSAPTTSPPWARPPGGSATHRPRRPWQRTAGRAEAAAWGLTSAGFETRDAATLDDVAAYVLVTAFHAIHDQAHPATVLANIQRALRPGGTFLMVDIASSSNLEENVDTPWASLLYAISLTHCMSVSLAQGGDGLGTVWGVQRAERMLRGAGFTSVVRRALEEDPFNVYFVATA